MNRRNTSRTARRRRRFFTRGDGRPATALAIAGAVGGGFVGAFLGPVGILAGAALGGTAGAFAGAAWGDSNRVAARRDEELDEDLGIIGGDIGAPNLKHPPPKVGVYSAQAAGISARDAAEERADEGPIPRER